MLCFHVNHSMYLPLCKTHSVSFVSNQQISKSFLEIHGFVMYSSWPVPNVGAFNFFRSSSTEFKTTLNWRDSNIHAILMAVFFFLCLSSWKYVGTLKAFWSTFNQVDDLLSHRKQTTIFQYIPTSMNQYHNIKLIFITTFWKREKKNLVANTPLVREINGISRSQHAYTNMRGGGKIKRERVILYAQGNMEPLPLAADSSANDLTNRKIFMTETRNFLNHSSRLCFFFFLLEHVLDFSVRYMFDVTWCLYYSYKLLKCLNIQLSWWWDTICAACSLAVICGTFDKHAIQPGVEAVFRFLLQSVQTV